MTEWCSWWTEARTEELKARWANRESARDIAAAMGSASRNAVIGKVHRLKLTPRAAVNGAKSPRSRKRRVRRVVRYDSRFVIMEHEHMIEEDPPGGFAAGKLFAELEPGDCRFPGAGDGPNLLFCAAPQLAGYSYCAAHCRIAFAGKPAPKAPRS